MIKSKICKKCKLNKPFGDFGKSKDGKYGYKSRCKKCLSEEAATYFNKNKERILKVHKKWRDNNPTKGKENRLKTRYGISLKLFLLKLIEQDERCRICGKHSDALKDGLCVDHDHKTGKVRGLLCRGCNRAVGNIYDSWKTAESMVEYLKEHNP